MARDWISAAASPSATLITGTEPAMQQGAEWRDFWEICSCPHGMVPGTSCYCAVRDGWGWCCNCRSLPRVSTARRERQQLGNSFVRRCGLEWISMDRAHLVVRVHHEKLDRARST
ncbi:hypothetical protein SETIT_5G094300v2 [Setaria italica]|uniref:Uncharacterized protein n=1 Tax=Setaria italica TaxID=4555 RepID=A0A368R2X5_SETIT|nr:hypothetical protein SETIT_5G094300v2 [Setaria italica]